MGYYQNNSEFIYCHNIENIIKFKKRSFSPIFVKSALNSHSEVKSAKLVEVWNVLGAIFKNTFVPNFSYKHNYFHLPDTE